MAFVLDASVAVAWAFAEEDHAEAAAALALIRNDQGCVPACGGSELRNVLIVNERRGRLRDTDTAVFLRNLGRLPIAVDRAPEEMAVLALARRDDLAAMTLLTSNWQRATPRRSPPLT